MGFLTDDDYKQLMRLDIRTTIIDGDASIQQTAETEARKMVESYLRIRYDIAAIFAATGTDRHPLIILQMVRIALALLLPRVSPRLMSEQRKQDYDAAIQWLTDAREGLIEPDLPLKVANPGQSVGEIRLGSQKPIPNGY